MSKLANERTIEEHNKELERSIEDLEVLVDRLTKDVREQDQQLKDMKQDQDDMWELIAGKDADKVKKIIREARRGK